MAFAVEVKRLSKHFRGGDVRAIDGVDLATGEGEYLVLLGPSGCGKTTLLRTIAGLEEPTEGEVLIGGNVVNGLAPRARKIAMVFQSYALYPHKTVAQNITFPLKAAGMAPAERERRAAWAAELLEIAELLDRKPRQLSGGERQRVALARALVREPDVFLLDEPLSNPDVFLLDEPLSNLDAKLRATARDELKGFQRRVGTTTIYVTHDQTEAMGLGDRIAVMYRGRIRQLGEPKEVYLRPADTFVATFLGSPPMNLVARGDELLGFRPESFLPLALVDGGDRRVGAQFDVDRVEYLSGDRLIYGTVRGLGDETRVISKLGATVSVPIEAGRVHEFALHERDLCRFHAESGLRVEAG